MVIHTPLIDWKKYLHCLQCGRKNSCTDQLFHPNPLKSPIVRPLIPLVPHHLTSESSQQVGDAHIEPSQATFKSDAHDHLKDDQRATVDHPVVKD